MLTSLGCESDSPNWAFGPGGGDTTTAVLPGSCLGAVTAGWFNVSMTLLLSEPTAGGIVTTNSSSQAVQLSSAELLASAIVSQLDAQLLGATVPPNARLCTSAAAPPRIASEAVIRLAPPNASTAAATTLQPATAVTAPPPSTVLQSARGSNSSACTELTSTSLVRLQQEISADLATVSGGGIVRGLGVPPPPPSGGTGGVGLVLPDGSNPLDQSLSGAADPERADAAAGSNSGTRGASGIDGGASGAGIAAPPPKGADDGNRSSTILPIWMWVVVAIASILTITGCFVLGGFVTRRRTRRQYARSQAAAVSQAAAARATLVAIPGVDPADHDAVRRVAAAAARDAAAAAAAAEAAAAAAAEDALQAEQVELAVRDGGFVVAGTQNGGSVAEVAAGAAAGDGAGGGAGADTDVGSAAGAPAGMATLGVAAMWARPSFGRLAATASGHFSAPASPSGAGPFRRCSTFAGGEEAGIGAAAGASAGGQGIRPAGPSASPALANRAAAAANTSGAAGSAPGDTTGRGVLSSVAAMSAARPAAGRPAFIAGDRVRRLPRKSVTFYGRSTSSLGGDGFGGGSAGLGQPQLHDIAHRAALAAASVRRLRASATGAMGSPRPEDILAAAAASDAPSRKLALYSDTRLRRSSLPVMLGDDVLLAASAGAGVGIANSGLSGGFVSAAKGSQRGSTSGVTGDDNRRKSGDTSPFTTAAAAARLASAARRRSENSGLAAASGGDAPSSPSAFRRLLAPPSSNVGPLNQGIENDDMGSAVLSRSGAFAPGTADLESARQELLLAAARGGIAVGAAGGGASGMGGSWRQRRASATAAEGALASDSGMPASSKTRRSLLLGMTLSPAGYAPGGAGTFDGGSPRAAPDSAAMHSPRRSMLGSLLNGLTRSGRFSISGAGESAAADGGGGGGVAELQVARSSGGTNFASDIQTAALRRAAATKAAAAASSAAVGGTGSGVAGKRALGRSESLRSLPHAWSTEPAASPGESQSQPLLRPLSLDDVGGASAGNRVAPVHAPSRLGMGQQPTSRPQTYAGGSALSWVSPTSPNNPGGRTSASRGRSPDDLEAAREPPPQRRQAAATTSGYMPSGAGSSSSSPRMARSSSVRDPSGILASPLAARPESVRRLGRRASVSSVPLLDESATVLGGGGVAGAQQPQDGSDLSIPNSPMRVASVTAAAVGAAAPSSRAGSGVGHWQSRLASMPPPPPPPVALPPSTTSGTLLGGGLSPHGGGKRASAGGLSPEASSPGAITAIATAAAAATGRRWRATVDSYASGLSAPGGARSSSAHSGGAVAAGGRAVSADEHVAASGHALTSSPGGLGSPRQSATLGRLGAMVGAGRPSTGREPGTSNRFAAAAAPGGSRSAVFMQHNPLSLIEDNDDEEGERANKLPPQSPALPPPGPAWPSLAAAGDAPSPFASSTVFANDWAANATTASGSTGVGAAMKPSPLRNADLRMTSSAGPIGTSLLAAPRPAVVIRLPAPTAEPAAPRRPTVPAPMPESGPGGAPLVDSMRRLDELIQHYKERR